MTLPRICTECRHHTLGFNDLVMCAHPNARDVVDGKPVNAGMVRASIGVCGPEGRLWESAKSPEMPTAPNET